MAKNGTKGKVGEVTQILGSVVDIRFSADDMPETYFAVEIPREGQDPLVAEVQQHMGNHTVRAVSMGSTDGLARGAKAINTATSRAALPPLCSSSSMVPYATGDWAQGQWRIRVRPGALAPGLAHEQVRAGDAKAVGTPLY